MWLSILATSGIVLGPVIVFAGIGIWVFGLPAWPRRWRVHLRRRTKSEVLSLESLVKELHRLERDLQRADRGLPSARTHRVRTLTLKYDETLRQCCELLGLDQPSDPPLEPLDRIQTEADLCLHGIKW